MNKEQVKRLIKDNENIIKSYGAKRIGLFGSITKNKLGKESDIDLFIEFEKGKATLKNVSGLIDFLEELFRRKIDILTPYGLETIRIKSIKERIKKEIEYI